MCQLIIIDQLIIFNILHKDYEYVLLKKLPKGFYLPCPLLFLSLVLCIKVYCDV